MQLGIWQRRRLRPKRYVLLNPADSTSGLRQIEPSPGRIGHGLKLPTGRPAQAYPCGTLIR
jgi:hypothetical protein